MPNRARRFGNLTGIAVMDVLDRFSPSATGEIMMARLQKLRRHTMSP